MPTVHSGLINRVFILSFVLIYSAVVIVTTVAAVKLLLQPAWLNRDSVNIYQALACGLSLVMTGVEYYYLLVVLKQAWSECYQPRRLTETSKAPSSRVITEHYSDGADLWYHDPSQALFVKS